MLKRLVFGLGIWPQVRYHRGTNQERRGVGCQGLTPACRAQGADDYVSRTSDKIAGEDEAADRAPRVSLRFCTVVSRRRLFPYPPIALEMLLGNQRVAQLIQAKRLTPEGGIIGLQRKLTVGAANDQYEQEADRVARQVLNTSHAVAGQSLQRAMAPEDDKDQKIQTKPLAVSITSLLQRQGMNTEEPDDKEETVQAKSLAGTSSESVQRQPETDEEEKTIQTKSAGALAGSFDAETNVESQISQSKGHGSPLPEQVRAYMEPRFGADFSHVRVHTGSEAIQMTRDVSAQAFTHGSDIYFGAGSSPNNLELTAHELTHVVQQTGSVPLQTKRLDGASTTNVGLSLQRVCSACAAGDKEEKASVPISQQGKQTVADGRAVNPVALAAARFAAPAAGALRISRDDKVDPQAASKAADAVAVKAKDWPQAADGSERLHRRRDRRVRQEAEVGTRQSSCTRLGLARFSASRGSKLLAPHLVEKGKYSRGQLILKGEAAITTVGLTSVTYDAGMGSNLFNDRPRR